MGNGFNFSWESTKLFSEGLRAGPYTVMQNLNFCPKIQIPKKSIFCPKLLKTIKMGFLDFLIYDKFSLFCITVPYRYYDNGTQISQTSHGPRHLSSGKDIGSSFFLLPQVRNGTEVLFFLHSLCSICPIFPIFISRSRKKILVYNILVQRELFPG